MIKLSSDISALLGEEPFDTLMTLRGDVYREQGDRETVRIELNQVPYFIKRYRRDMIKPGAKPEWEALRLCEQMGVSVPVLKGFGARGMQSFVLMEALVDAKSLEDMPLSWKERQTVIVQLAAMAKKLHEQGYYHRDFYICHFFWNKKAEKLTLIDLHRLFKPLFFKRHFHEKDLSSLFFSVMNMGIRQRDVFKFLKLYFNLSLHDIFKEHAALLAACEKKAIALYQKAYHELPRHVSWLQHRADWPLCVGEFYHQYDINGKLLLSDTCLRVLGTRRAVLAGMLGPDRVVVKFFKDKREYDRECAALDVVAQSPALPIIKKIEAICQHNGYYTIIYPFIPGHAPNEMSAQLLGLFALLHQHQLIQSDPHLDNFRKSGDTLFLLDPASIRPARSEKDHWQNLALLYAQWSPLHDDEHMKLLHHYVEAMGKKWSDDMTPMFKEYVKRARNEGIRKWLSKICRNSTLYYAKSRLSLRVFAKRAFANVYTQTLMRFPDSYFQDHSDYLKQGRSNTVIRATIGTNDVVIKRYNIKSVLHVLKNLWRGSKAKRAWRNAHLCLALGILTPEPLMMIEKRFLSIPLQSYLVTRFANGRRLDQMDRSALTPAVCQQMATAIQQAFDLLATVQCYHGDLKASNWIWDGHDMQLIDLDSLKHISNSRLFQLYHQKDKARFLENFDVTHPLHAMLL